MNLIEGLLKEIDRVNEVIAVYRLYPGGYFAATSMEAAICSAKRSLIEGDVVKMLSDLNNLKSFQL